MINNVDKEMTKLIFENIKKGEFPKFGSPTTRCDKCMFANVTCATSSEYVGCLGGWQRE